MLKTRGCYGGEQDYSVQVTIEVVNNSAVCSALREYQKNWLPGYVSSYAAAGPSPSLPSI